MAIDPKATWPVVKFLIAATGFRRREARALLDEIPREQYSKLFIEAMAWDRDTSGQASKTFRDILGSHPIEALDRVTERAQRPSTDDGDDEEPEPAKPVARKRTAVRR
jgi:hypothetical protein